MKAGTDCSQLMEDSVLTATEENEQRFVMVRSGHLVEERSRCREGSVGTDGRYWSSLLET